jgi:hypothetical protein
MGTSQEEARGDSNVASMEEFLRDLLRDADQLDQTLTTLHSNVREARDHLRSRLYALHLADDTAFQSDVDQLHQDVQDGTPPQTFSLAEVLEREALA